MFWFGCVDVVRLLSWLKRKGTPLCRSMVRPFGRSVYSLEELLSPNCAIKCADSMGKLSCEARQILLFLVSHSIPAKPKEIQITPEHNTPKLVQVNTRQPRRTIE